MIIVEQGSHAVLLEAGGVYRALHEAQFGEWAAQGVGRAGPVHRCRHAAQSTSSLSITFFIAP